MREPTRRQLQVLNFIKSYIADKGYPPTMREVSGYLGITVSTVFAHLAALQRKGLITTEAGKPRTLRVVA